jgi:signal transduction histidine kinase
MPRLPPLSEITLFRIAQEALTNVARHAQADRATVTLELTVDTARLLIDDDGIGFAPAVEEDTDRRPSWGLLLMIERAEAMGGACRIESSPGAGTRVFVEIRR